jgi:hypothetical protein
MKMLQAGLYLRSSELKSKIEKSRDELKAAQAQRDRAFVF